MIGKKEMAAQLQETADLLEVLGDDPFRSRAYRNAARRIEAYDGDVLMLLREGRLTDIQGVGRGLAEELSAAAESGTLPLLESLRQQVPAEVQELFRVGGLGPRKIARLWQAGIGELEELLAAVEDGRLASLKGFGTRSAAGIGRGARFALDSRERLRLDQAEALAGELLRRLGAALPGARLQVAGELRRGLETVGELELVVAGVALERLREALAGLQDTIEPNTIDLDITSGNSLVGMMAGRRLRLTLAPPAAFGALLALRTGSAAYLEVLERAAARRGLTLGEEGLRSASELVPTPTEAEFFERLGLPLPPPELREEADARALPGLLTLGEIRGLVHNHSDWSDGACSLREMAAAARERGFAYLALADHSRTSSYAGGLSIERVCAQAREVREIREELRAEGSDFQLLHGLEVDILADGSLDYPDEVLAELDYTVVSVHQNFTLPREEQTARLVRAVRHPLATILGHPSGRLLLRRPGYDVDLQAVIEACAQSGTVIEINANPRRLDLDWRWVRRARELDCRFAIDPDAHRASGYDDLRYGVTMARKAGLTVREVVNCAVTGEAFLARLKVARANAS